VQRLAPLPERFSPLDSLVPYYPSLRLFGGCFAHNHPPLTPTTLLVSLRPADDQSICFLLPPSLPSYRRRTREQLLESDGKATSYRKSQPQWKIGRQDVANLLVAAMAHKKAARSTLTCSWGKDKKREG